MQECKLRSLEDIKKEKESSIEKINESKTDVEEEISNVVDKLDDTLEELEKSYNSKLESVSKSLKKSVNIFEDKAKKVKKGFLGIYNIIIIIIMYLIIEIIANYNSVSSVTSNISVSSNSSTQILSLLAPSIAFILILGLVFKVYENINSIDNSSDISDKINNIDKNIVSALEIPSYPQKIEVEKSFFNEKKAILSSAIISVGKVIPVVENIYDEVNLLVEYQQIVNNFGSSLEFYNLVEDKEFLEEIGKYAPADVHILNDKDLWKKLIAQKIVSQLNTQKIGQKFTFSINLLLLLYEEHNSEQSTNVFRDVVSSENEIQTLALILIRSQKLMESNDYEYKKEDIIAIIRKEESFSLPNLNYLLSNSFLTLNYLNSYVKFLKKNGIDILYNPTIEYIINKSEGISYEKRVAKLAYNLGLENFNKIDGLNRYFADGFARASLALKFHDDVSLREMICKCSAKDCSTAILYSYFEKIKENDGQKIVLVKELINDIENINFFLNKLEDPDIKFFQAQLKEGQWHDSSFSLLREFFKKSKEEILEKLSSRDELEMLKESIKSIYQEVNIETIEKSIDAQLFGVYVIMFHSTGSQTSGNNEDTLKDIIDKLSIRDLEKDREKRWKFRDDQQKEEIKEKYKVYPKYDFINFSNSTRIGILDKDQSFQNFKQDFFNDVKTILNLKDGHFDIGIIVHKIMPSKHTFGILDKDQLSEKIEIKDLDAVKYIARLATKIPLEDQVSGMKLEKINLLKIIDEKSLYEILKLINDDIKDKIEIDVLSASELKICLLNELNEKLSIKDFRSLSLDLKEEIYDEKDIKMISKVIESVLKSRYSIEENLSKKVKSRPAILAKRFIKSLKNLAILYELQKND
jgi:hypothetical protein